MKNSSPPINDKERQKSVLTDEERMRIFANLLIDRVLEEKGRDRTIQIQNNEHFTIINKKAQQISWGGENHA